MQKNGISEFIRFEAITKRMIFRQIDLENEFQLNRHFAIFGRPDAKDLITKYSRYGRIAKTVEFLSLTLKIKLKGVDDLATVRRPKAISRVANA